MIPILAVEVSVRIHCVCLLILAFAIGCASTKFDRQGTVSSTTPLKAGGTAYVVLCQDGQYGESKYEGSGKTTAQAIVEAFSPYVTRVELGANPEPFAAAIQSAKNGGYTYMLQPQILHWEGRATEWSGKSDRILIKLSIYQGATGELIDSATITGKSAWATFGGDEPQDLLPKPLKEYAASLFTPESKLDK